MKRTAKLLVAVLALALLLSLPAHAFALTQRTGDSISVTENVKDDLYLFGTTIDVSGNVDGDVVAFGNNIRVTGDVTGGIITAGQNITISGTVGGTVRAAGSNVTLEGQIDGDALAAGNNVILASSGSIGRDVALGAATVVLDGDVSRNVLGGAGRMTVNSRVGGDVTADVDRLTIASGSVVAGDVTYYSNNQATVNGDVRGQVDQRPARAARGVERTPAQAAFFAVWTWFRGLIALAILAIVTVLAARRLMERGAREAWYGRPAASVGIGFAIAVVAAPIAGLIFLLGLLIGGWWLSFVWLGIVWLLALFGLVVGALAIGNWIFNATAHRTYHPIVAALLGVLVISVIGAIPFIGWLAAFVAMLLGMGALVLTAYRPQGPPTLATEPAPAVPPTMQQPPSRPPAVPPRVPPPVSP